MTKNVENLKKSIKNIPLLFLTCYWSWNNQHRGSYLCLCRRLRHCGRRSYCYLFHCHCTLCCWCHHGLYRRYCRHHSRGCSAVAYSANVAVYSGRSSRDSASPDQQTTERKRPSHYIMLITVVLCKIGRFACAIDSVAADVIWPTSIVPASGSFIDETWMDGRFSRAEFIAETHLLL